MRLLGFVVGIGNGLMINEAGDCGVVDDAEGDASARNIPTPSGVPHSERDCCDDVS